MKKLLALLLALVMVLSLFAACGSSAEDEDDKKETTSEEKNNDKGDEEEKPAQKDDAADAVAKYVEKNSEALIQTWSAGVEQDCDISVKAEGCGIVINMCITGWDNVPQEQKDQWQAIYDSAAETYSALMDMARIELPELEFMTFNYCEEDGDIIATLTIE